MHDPNRDPRSEWSLEDERLAALQPEHRPQPGAASIDVFASPGALQPPEVLASALGDGDEAGAPGPDSTVWLVLDHQYGRCLAFCRTRAVAESWLAVYIASGLLAAERASIQPCLLRGDPPAA